MVRRGQENFGWLLVKTHVNIRFGMEKKLTKTSILTYSFVIVLMIYLTNYGYHGYQQRWINQEMAKTYEAIKPYLKEPNTHTERQVKESYSQAGQEQFVYDLLQKENGFFVEMGAFNGQTFSNTFWLENRHGWAGLLIEADPKLCQAIDKLGRKSWRLCACISDRKNMSFYQGGALGGTEDNFNDNMFKQLGKKPNKITVPCFKLRDVLQFINREHVDYFSLDVEGAEMMVLESIKTALKSGAITVDVWTIEYRVWNGSQVVLEDSMQNLRNLRNFFKSVGGYVEHSHLSNDKNNIEGLALDVVFVRNWVWCKKHETLPDDSGC